MNAWQVINIVLNSINCKKAVAIIDTPHTHRSSREKDTHTHLHSLGHMYAHRTGTDWNVRALCERETVTAFGPHHRQIVKAFSRTHIETLSVCARAGDGCPHFFVVYIYFSRRFIRLFIFRYFLLSGHFRRNKIGIRSILVRTAYFVFSSLMFNTSINVIKSKIHYYIIDIGFIAMSYRCGCGCLDWTHSVLLTKCRHFWRTKNGRSRTQTELCRYTR